MPRKKVNVEAEPWQYGNRVIQTLEDCPKGSYGFIYCIEDRVSGQRYIGKKALHSYRTKRVKKLNERTGRINTVREVEVLESNWQQYYGSSLEIKDLIKSRGSRKDFMRYIIRFCFSKKELTFREIQEQCKADVLDNDQYINSNIVGKFFKGEFKL